MKIVSKIKRFFGRDSEGFSDFFLRASPQEKKQVFRRAAERANEEQRKVYEESDLEMKIR